MLAVWALEKCCLMLEWREASTVNGKATVMAAQLKRHAVQSWPLADRRVMAGSLQPWPSEKQPQTAWHHGGRFVAQHSREQWRAWTQEPALFRQSPPLLAGGSFSKQRLLLQGGQASYVSQAQPR